MRTLVLLLLLFPAVASAQTASFQFTVTDDKFDLSAADCGTELVVQWTANKGSTATACEDLEIWITPGSSCQEDGPGGTDLLAIPAPNLESGTGTVTFQVDNLPVFNDTDGQCGAQRTSTLSLCGRFSMPQSSGIGLPSCGSNNLVLADKIPVIYDGLPPPAPTLSRVEAQDEALQASVAPKGDTTELFLEWQLASADPAGEWKPTAAVAIGAALRITGLVNDTQYRVRARARDDAGNTSDASNVELGTPRNSAGFFETYKAAGGEETGGCTAVGGGLGSTAGLLAVMALAGLRRARR
jgi:hypothetical protein